MNAYTYLVGWSEHGKFYYGAQWNKKANPDALWVTYFTSSRHVREFRELHGEPDVIMIRKTFGEDVSACREWEERVLTRARAKKKQHWLNVRATSNRWFAPDGVIVVKDLKNGKLRHATLDEFRANPDLVGHTHGMLTAADKKTGKKVRVSREEYASNPDLEFHTAGYIPTEESRKAASNRMSGKVFAKTISGDIIHISKDEFRTNHDLVGANTGYTQPIDARQKIAESKIGKPRPAHVGEAVGKASLGMVAALNVKTGIVARVTAEEFRSNPDLIGPSSGRVIPDDERNRRAAATRGKTTGMVTCRDIRTGEKRKVPRSVFDADPHLVGMRSRIPNLV